MMISARGQRKQRTPSQQAALVAALQALDAVGNHDDHDDDDRYCLVCRTVECITHYHDCPIGRAMLMLAKQISGDHGIPQEVAGVAIRVEDPESCFACWHDPGERVLPRR